jgi:hypothetical protein
MNVNSTEATSGPRMGVVEGFHDDQFTSSNYPFGMSEDEFERRSVVYETYYTLHYSRPYSYCDYGSSRPYPPLCMNADCRQEIAKITLLVNVRADKLHANTPILGWCSCICCKGCVGRMVSVDNYRGCPACGHNLSHQDFYLMYPLSSSSVDYNRVRSKQNVMEMEKRKALADAGVAADVAQTGTGVVIVD